MHLPAKNPGTRILTNEVFLEIIKKPMTGPLSAKAIPIQKPFKIERNDDCHRGKHAGCSDPEFDIFFYWKLTRVLSQSVRHHQPNVLTNCTFPPISVKNIRSFSRFRNVPRPLELPPNFRSRETDNPSPDTAIFPNLVGAPSATCLIWEYTESIPGTPCPNPRAILSRSIMPDAVNEAARVHYQNFSLHTPPCTSKKPTYGIVGHLHFLL